MCRQDIKIDKTGPRRVPGLPRWKRALDFVIILILAPGLLILGGGVALLIICGSGGPILFRQRRIGHGGRQFTCYKFRTMRVGAETESHRGHTSHLIRSETPMTKLDTCRDPRVIPLGGALRATGLDELPQLINVLWGEMSIVGPRPCISYEYELYEPWQQRRCNAVPGLTGLWQVSGKNRTTFNQMIRLDIEYAERLSLGLDVLILIKTLPALWRQCLDLRAPKRKAEASSTTDTAKSIHSQDL